MLKGAKSETFAQRHNTSGSGDIARIHSKLEKENVYRHLKKIKNEKLLAIINSTIEDIEMFVKE